MKISSSRKTLSAIFATAALGAPIAVHAVSSLNIDDVSGSCGQEVVVPIDAGNASALEAFGFDLTIGGTCALDLVRVEAGELLGGTTGGWNVQANTVDSNTIRIGGIRSSAMMANGSDTLVYVVFQSTVATACDCVSPLGITSTVDQVAGATVSGGNLSLTDTAEVDPTLLSSFTFDSSTEGWTYTANPASGDPPFAIDSNGYLLLASNNSSGTFGFYNTSDTGLVLDEFTPAGGDLAAQRGPLYLVRSAIRRTTADPERSPKLRMRVNHKTFADFHTLEVQSPPSGFNLPTRFIPDIYESETVDFLFEPNIMNYALDRGDQSYSIAFDLINFDTTDDPFGGYLLDSVEVFKIPRGAITEEPATRTYTFQSAADTDAWTAFTFPGSFLEPTAGEDTSGDGFITFAVTDTSDVTYGNYQSEELTATLPSTSDKLFVELHVQNVNDAANASQIPATLGFRAQTPLFQRINTVGVVNIPNSTLPSSNGVLRNHFAFMEVPAEDVASGSTSFTFAWDVVGFGTATTSDLNRVDTVVATIIRIANYPE